MPHLRLLTLACLLALPVVPRAQEKDTPPASKTVEQLAEAARGSIVVIRTTGRDGKQQGLGTGFVVTKDGLIATNLHVLGEGRPIEIRTAGGKTYPVTAIHASDRSLDLALVRVEAKGLKALELGDSDSLKDGQAVVALGHPRGLEHSIVSGVVSGRQQIDGKKMIQVAIPIEQGNSGGPLLDMQGRVRAVITLKAQKTANLGFAMPVNALKALLARPNPVPIARWITIGTLNTEDWAVVHEGRWRQRNGTITADGIGAGFGGRSLCLWKHPLPKLPYEVTATVRLGDERDAGGLVFHADGGEKHYGFYPSNGELRFVRFMGPDVYSWKILFRESSPHYRPGEWNVLKVRVEKEKFRCYVNDQLVLEADDRGLTSGRVGLAKFRNSLVEFKNFRVAEKLPPSRPAAELVKRVHKTVTDIPPEGKPKAKLVEKLLPDAPASLGVLRDKARQLEQQAARLRELAAAVHHKAVLGDLERATRGLDAGIDLIHAALLIARLDNEEVDVESYRQQVERMAREIAAGLPKKASDKQKLAALNKGLFEDRGFHGSRGDYYHRDNSYLNAVLDDREGLPITLSLLYIEVGRRLGLTLEGVGLPGHFVVRHGPAKGKPQLIDVYEGGKSMSVEEADRKVRAITGEGLREEDLGSVSKRAILVRVLSNLRNLAKRDEDAAAFLRYTDSILAVTPDAAHERALRAELRWRTGDLAGALVDVDWLLENNPPGLDRQRLMELRRRLAEPQ
jgi:regulator of sirC expression with transglutaminase-like and TPR domain